jgi:hypothetical protein
MDCCAVVSKVIEDAFRIIFSGFNANLERFGCVLDLDLDDLESQFLLSGIIRVKICIDII